MLHRRQIGRVLPTLQARSLLLSLSHAAPCAVKFAQLCFLVCKLLKLLEHTGACSEVPASYQKTKFDHVCTCVWVTSLFCAFEYLVLKIKAAPVRFNKNKNMQTE